MMEANPNLKGDVDTIKDILYSTADTLEDLTGTPHTGDGEGNYHHLVVGAGLVNAHEAVKVAEALVPDGTIFGCTDPTACANYDPTANTDDGSCWYVDDDPECGICGGSGIDDCGVCNGIGFPFCPDSPFYQYNYGVCDFINEDDSFLDIELDLQYHEIDLGHESAWKIQSMLDTYNTVHNPSTPNKIKLRDHLGKFILIERFRPG
tara:strand:- start:90 stop:707 length:618 start_codon:yes stop_codon:yes gene_type:complete